MDLVIVGPGRAGMSLALAARRAGVGIAAVVGRDAEAVRRAAGRVDGRPLGLDEPLPSADLLVLAVRDDAIAPVAGRIAPHATAVAAAVHLSGLAPVDRIASLRPLPVGSFHPLQTLPDPEAGSEAIDGAWVAVTTADEALEGTLRSLAARLGMHPFALDDDAKPLYHAAAATAANYPLAALAMAQRLYEAAGVPFEAAGPLVRAVVDNALGMGPERALTGPVARGDVSTVAAQLEAVATATPGLAAHFAALAALTAEIAGTTDVLDEVLP